MSEPDDNGFHDVPAAGEGERRGADDLNDAFKLGLRRAGMHWVRAGYEILAGVGALLEELSPRGEDQQTSPADPAERIELE